MKLMIISDCMKILGIDNDLKNKICKIFVEFHVKKYEWDFNLDKHTYFFLAKLAWSAKNMYCSICHVLEIPKIFASALKIKETKRGKSSNYRLSQLRVVQANLIRVFND